MPYGVYKHKPPSKEARLKMRLAKLGKKQNPIFVKKRTKASIAAKKKKGIPIGYTKGHKPWNKGKKLDLTPEQRKSFGNYSRGRKQTTEHIEKRVKKLRGAKRMPRSAEWCEKLSKGHMGIPTWNKGLTKETDIRVKKSTEKQSKTNIERLKNDNHFGKAFRKDLNQYFRTKFEANYARYLNSIGIIWEYETERCIFKLSNGKYYICDFYLPKINEYIELKGWLRKDAEEKIKLFKKDYPKIKWQILFYDSKEWGNITRKCCDTILNWEHSQREKYTGLYPRRNKTCL